MRKLAKIEVILPRAAERKIDDLIVFDACCLDVGARQEFLRLFPQIVHLRRARKAYFEEHGCPMCPKSDPTLMIAARLHRRGSTWAEIYEITRPTRSHVQPWSHITLAERKRFKRAVHWELSRFDVSARKPSHRYGAGGLCDRCYGRLRRELAKALRKMHEGRNAEEETAALTRRFDVAQWLLGGDK